MEKNLEKTGISLLFIILFILGMVQVTYKITQKPVRIWDEASSAQNAIEMLKTKSYLVVLHDGNPEHHDTRPPMSVWTKVLSYKLFGINPLGVRMPSILAVALTMLAFVLFSVYYLQNIKSGLAFLILVSCTGGYMRHHVARTGDPDALLVLFVSCYVLLYFILLEKYPRSRIKYLTLFGLFIVLAAYTKSIQGLAPIAGLGVYTLIKQNGLKLLKDYRFHLTWLSVVVAISAYYILRSFQDPSYLQAVYQQEFLTINNPLEVKHPEFDYYYNYLKDYGFYPFFSFLPLVLIPLLFSSNKQAKNLIIYGLTGAATFLIGQSSVTIKNHWYIAPVYPFLWIVSAITISEIIRMISLIWISNQRRFIAQTILFLAVIWLSFPTYLSILKFNTDNPHKYIYPLERAGNYFDKFKKDHPGIKNLHVINPEHPRQLKFYAKKYDYLDSTKTIIHRKYSKDLSHQKVLVCNDSLECLIESDYRHKVIDSGKYCKVYQLYELAKGHSNCNDN